MIGTVGGNPLAAQLQAYNSTRPSEAQPQNPNDKLKPASESEDSASTTIQATTSDRAYDSGGISAGTDQRGGSLDISV